MEGLTILGFVVAGIFAGAFGGRTGMLMLWKRGVHIVELPRDDDESYSRKEEAIFIGIVHGTMVGGLLGGLFASSGVSGVDVSRGTLGVVLSLFAVPIAYVLLLNVIRFMSFLLGMSGRVVRRVSDALISLIPGEPKEP